VWAKIKAFFKKYGGYFVAFLVGSQVFSSPLDELEQILGSYEQLTTNLQREHQQLIQQADRLRVESQQAGDALGRT